MIQDLYVGGDTMKRVLAVFAHPDDETFICGGTLAKLAKTGHRVALACATRGEMGRRMGVPPTATRESIGQVREQELKLACDALGVVDVHFMNYRDKSLEIQVESELIDAVRKQVEAAQPDVVITFHEQLGGHPDHCTIGSATTAAFQAYQLAHPQSALLFVTWTKEVSNPEGLNVLKRVLVVDVSDVLQEKRRAYRAHLTQSGMNSWLFDDLSASLSRLGHREHFLQSQTSSKAVDVKSLLPGIFR